ncbi:3-isopropylmalate dehydrogenase [Deinococcus irradiatisoli]|uniref:3-isopropylmalate dehydrogenase n=1 Tax=Deinococcus irradiatisoli TaxID=2202254 RepID=A0A2Z3JC43_9DEIO|nr:3-isopropylmalate dehydrogenase [Deinococcus irradiatisoli]AWN22723.1 3-isopropylmalate dehydrogenase [Deinococcus irradiatisoli]
MPNVVVLAGDGIGPEVCASAVEVLRAVAPDVELEHHLLGGGAYDQTGSPFPDATRQAVLACDAVLLGTVGGAQNSPWNSLPRPLRPESGLLQLRMALGVYANLRPVKVMPGLEGFSPLREDLARQVDVLIVRELLGGAYFDPRRAIEGDQAYNTIGYSKAEVDRVARVAFDAARTRKHEVTSVDKANVLEVSELWRGVVQDLRDREYPEVKLEHEYVDSVAMLLVKTPGRYDVIVTENLFGDILSDLAAVIPGSLGVMPSASLGDGPGLYEPIHGSAPDIAGKGVANPTGTILSVAMLLRHSLGRDTEARRIEDAVQGALEHVRTPDLGGQGTTQELGAAVLARL